MDFKLLKSLSDELLLQIIDEAKMELKTRKKTKKINQRRKVIQRLNFREFDANSIYKINSKNLLSLRNINEKITDRKKYFTALLDQNWNDIYPQKNDIGEHYVYVHVDPNEWLFNVALKYGGNYGGTPFYVGKGIENRAFILKRNQGHGKKIKDILASGWQVDDIVHIPFKNLSEQKAFEIEAKLIYFFGSIYQQERQNVKLYNLEIPKTPDFIDVMKKIPTRKQMINFDIRLDNATMENEK